MSVKELLSSIPNKNKVAIISFLCICGVSGAILPNILKQVQTDLDNGTGSEIVQTNTGSTENGTGSLMEEKINKNNLYSYKLNDKEYSFKVGEDGWSHILLGGLKTSSGHENNILTLISFNPVKEKVVYNIFDPRVRFDEGTVNPQEIANGSSLISGLSKDLGFEIQYYGTLGQNSLGDLTRNFIDVNTKIYENGINVGTTFIKDNASGFELLTSNKGTIQNNEIVSNFLKEVTFDNQRNQFKKLIFDLFGKAGVGNNFTELELESIGLLVDKDGTTKNFNKVSNQFITGNENGFYEIVVVENQDGTKTGYGKITEKTKNIIKESLK